MAFCVPVQRPERGRASWWKGRTRILACVGMGAVLWGEPVMAQSPPAPTAGASGSAAAQASTPTARGAELFKEGVALMNAKSYAAATEKLEESYKLDPAPGTAANLASCEENQGHYTAAVRWWKVLLSLLPSGDSRRADAEKFLGDAEAKLGKIRMRPSPQAPPGITVTLDDRALDAKEMGAEIPVDPGSHRLVVSAPGHDARTLSVEAKSGEVSEVALTPGAVLPVASAPPKVEATVTKPVPSGAPSSAPAGGSSYTLPGVLAGTAGAFAVAGAVLSGDLIGGRYRHFVQECPVECKDGIIAQQVAINVSFGLAVVAGVAAATLVVLKLREPEAGTGTRVGLVVRPGGLGVVLER